MELCILLRRCRDAVAFVGIVMLAAVGPGPSVLAHDFSITDVLVVFKVSGIYEIDMTVDVDALALGAPPGGDSAGYAAQLAGMTPAEFEISVEQAEDTIRRRVRIRFDGAEQEPWVSFPELGTPLTDGLAVPTVLGTTARLSGRIPEGAVEFSFGASRSFNAVQLTILEQSTARGVKYALGPAEDSPPYRMGQASAPAGRVEVVARYVKLGYEHILPKGLDHILFVLGLFLLSPRLGPLLWQITAFTVAHSTTLGLSMAGVVSLPSRLVESLIALSIAYVAVENLVTTELKPWRLLLVFGFGLLHGLGFAGVLHELGLPEGEFLTALVGFNVGVELGQLSVVLLAFLALGWFQQHPRYRSRVVVPLSVIIAAVGLYWSIQRGLGFG